MDGATPGFTRADLAAGHPTVVKFLGLVVRALAASSSLCLEALAAQKGVALYGIVYKDVPEKIRAPSSMNSAIRFRD